MHHRLGAGGKVPNINRWASLGNQGSKGASELGERKSTRMGKPAVLVT